MIVNYATRNNRRGSNDDSLSSPCATTGVCNATIAQQPRLCNHCGVCMAWQNVVVRHGSPTARRRRHTLSVALHNAVVGYSDDEGVTVPPLQEGKETSIILRNQTQMLTFNVEPVEEGI